MIGWITLKQLRVPPRVNGWDDATRLNWLPVRLTGKAQTAWKRLTAEAKADFKAAKDALEKWFEPTVSASVTLLN